MKSFEDYFNEKFPDLVEAISCGDLIAKNYKVAIKEGFDLGAQSRQSEVDELKKRIDDAIKCMEKNRPMRMDYKHAIKALEILKGENHES